MAHFPKTSRPKPPPPGNEEASTVLNLGEFQDVETLTLSEASLVLNAIVQRRRERAAKVRPDGAPQMNLNETEYDDPSEGG